MNEAHGGEGAGKRDQTEPLDLREELALCEREPEVIDAVEQGSLGEELGRHVDACPACGDTFRVARLFALEGDRALADADRALAQPGRLPSADVIWRRARSETRRDAVERALWPIRLVERLSVIVAALAVVLGGRWLGAVLKPPLASMLEPFAGGAERVATSLATASGGSGAGVAASASPGSLVALVLALVLGALALGLYTSWSRQA